MTRVVVGVEVAAEKEEPGKGRVRALSRGGDGRGTPVQSLSGRSGSNKSDPPAGATSLCGRPLGKPLEGDRPAADFRNLLRPREEHRMSAEGKGTRFWVPWARSRAWLCEPTPG